MGRRGRLPRTSGCVRPKASAQAAMNLKLQAAAAGGPRERAGPGSGVKSPLARR
jgi:hypothetical protein